MTIKAKIPAATYLGPIEQLDASNGTVGQVLTVVSDGAYPGGKKWQASTASGIVWHVELARISSFTVDSTVDLGSWNTHVGMHLVSMRWNGGSGGTISQTYFFSTARNGTGGAWQLAPLHYSSQVNSAYVVLEVNVSSTTVSLRARRTADGGLGNIGLDCSVQFLGGGGAPPTFTPSTTTSTSAVTTKYADRLRLSALAQDGATSRQPMIWDDTAKLWVPGTLATTDISGLAAALALKAALASPALTGTPTAPTASPLTGNTQLATTAYVDAAVIAGAPPSGRVLLASQTLGAAAATVTFSSISNVYRDLELLLFVRGTNASDTVELRMQANGVTATGNYDSSQENRFGTVTVSAGSHTQLASLPAASNLANGAGAIRIIVPNYTNTTFHKSWHAWTWVRFGGGNGTVSHGGGTLRSTSAISQIDFFLSAGNFAANSEFRLYGLV